MKILGVFWEGWGIDRIWETRRNPHLKGKMGAPGEAHGGNDGLSYDEG